MTRDAAGVVVLTVCAGAVLRGSNVKLLELADLQEDVPETGMDCADTVHMFDEVRVATLKRPARMQERCAKQSSYNMMAARPAMGMCADGTLHLRSEAEPFISTSKAASQHSCGSSPQTRTEACRCCWSYGRKPCSLFPVQLVMSLHNASFLRLP